MKTVKCAQCGKAFPSAKMFTHVQYQCDKRPGAKVPVKRE